MDLIIQPRKPAPSPPRGTACSRALHAILVERRIPYQCTVAWDRAARALGMRYKTVHARGLAITVRRLSKDQEYVQSVLVDGEYDWEGYGIGESDIVVDIGGNVGSFALLAALIAPRGQVLSVEPVEESFRLLRRNAARNGLTNLIAVRGAIMDRPGQVEMILSRRDTGSHSVSGTVRAPVEEVAGIEVAPAMTLEDLFDKHSIYRCNLLKMDCEGAEFPIFEGLSQGMYERIDRIVMEFHCSSAETVPTEAGALVGRFLEAGYLIDSFIQHEGTPFGLIRCRRSP